MQQRILFFAVMAIGTPAWALPPSSSLSGSEGKLTWTVALADDVVTITGASPKWKVKHTAHADLTPISTEHVDADGAVSRVEYRKDGATVHKDGETITIKEAGLWDGDTVDIRLGHTMVGRKKIEFQALDPASGKAYGFEATNKGQAKCGAVACTHVKLVMTGAYRLLGPKWEYWYGADGKLLRFEGPIGKYKAG